MLILLADLCHPSVAKRKLRTLANDPVCILAWKAGKSLDSLWRGTWLNHLWSEFQLARRGYLGFLAARPADSLPPDCADLWFLYRLIRARRPNTVLELGSGFSTVIMAYALRENGGGMMWSIDADERWMGVTQSLLPKSLTPHCRILHCPAKAEDWRGYRVWRHAGLPEVTPDFLYVDGPGGDEGRTPAITADPLDLEPKFPLGFIMVIDGRYATYAFLKTHLQRRYRFTERPRFSNYLISLIA